MSLILICDESGAKGRATQRERFPGEVGVMAGYLLTTNQLQKAEADLDKICQPFRTSSGKLHVTDLGSDAPRLRAAIHNYFLRERIPILFEAIHADGFHEAHLNDPNRNRESLHTEIALGLFAKTVAFAPGNGQHSSDIQVITDRVDPPLLQGFFKAYEEFLDDAPVVKVRRRKHPDPEQRTRAWIDTLISWPEGYDADSFGVASYSITSDTSNRGLTVAADILAGDLAYYFRRRRGATFAGPLGQVGSVDGYALGRQCWGLTAPDGVPGVCDTIYCHPVHSARQGVAQLIPRVSQASVRARIIEIVRGRAYMICRADTKRTESAPDADWYQAREELCIPPELLL